MNAKTWPLFLALVLLAAPTRAQESVRDLGGPGQYDKLLSPGQVDRWVFEADEGETIVAHVASPSFDPILELARAGAKDDKALLEVDDPGNESRFAFRLPEKGRYEIRVHAFKYQGGGNYSLRVGRFRARPIEVGRPLTGTFDRTGKGYHSFRGAKDQIVVSDLKGAPSVTWKVLDFKGRELADWAGTVHLEDDGECYLVASGPADYRYDLLVRPARRQEVVEGQELAGSLQPGELVVCSFSGTPGAFRLLEVDKKGELLSRLLYAPLEKESGQRLARPGDRPDVVFLPVASRGGRLRFAALPGREGRYQLQLLARTAASYRLTVRDPGVPIERGQEARGSLPVGGATFYTFQAAPGQLLQAGLASQQFVPLLRLYDGRGSLVAGSGDDADGLEGRLTHLVADEGLYRLQVSSQGDGGGGDFRLTLTEAKPRELAVGGRGQGTVRPGGVDFWAFPGQEGKTVFLSVRSSAFEPAVSVRSPDGVLLAADTKGGAETGSLLALKLPRTGRYTVWVSARRGAGEYAVRLIDGD